MANILDKTGRLNAALAAGSVHLELGCGTRKRDAEAIGVDLLDSDAVDVLGELGEVLGSLPAQSVDRVTSHHCFEHVADFSELVKQIGRVLKPGGVCEFTVPHFSNPYYASDATHRTPFGLYTMSYFAHDNLFQRRVPTYQRSIDLELQHVRLEFKSTRPFYGRHAFKRMLGTLVNCSRYMQEFYEENLTGLLPCYELQFRLSKRSSA